MEQTHSFVATVSQGSSRLPTWKFPRGTADRLFLVVAIASFCTFAQAERYTTMFADSFLDANIVRGSVLISHKRQTLNVSESASGSVSRQDSIESTHTEATLGTTSSPQLFSGDAKESSADQLQKARDAAERARLGGQEARYILERSKEDSASTKYIDAIQHIRDMADRSREQAAVQRSHLDHLREQSALSVERMRAQRDRSEMMIDRLNTQREHILANQSAQRERLEALRSKLTDEMNSRMESAQELRSRALDRSVATFDRMRELRSKYSASSIDAIRDEFSSKIPLHTIDTVRDQMLAWADKAYNKSFSSVAGKMGGTVSTSLDTMRTVDQYWATVKDISKPFPQSPKRSYEVPYRPPNGGKH